MTFVFVLCAILLLLCLANYAVDFLFFLKDRYCRFHIGRWEKGAWKIAVEDRALRWLRKTPVVKITDNSRYILLDLITGKYRSHTIQSWQKAALILGLLESEKNISLSRAKHTASSLLDENGKWKTKLSRVDCGMLSYAILKASDDPVSVKAAMDESIAVIRRSINDAGMISYTGQIDNPDMYVDTIGLCCPFLVRYANEYGQPEFETIAFRQIESYHRYGMLNVTELPNHAFSLKYKLPLGVFGWGRGIGWYVIGLMDSYEEMENEEYRFALKDWIRDAAEEYKRFQRPDGGFGSIVQSTHTYDSSATAVLAWFYAKCSKLFDCEEYATVSEKCLKKLLSCTRINGAIDWCQGDTKGIGIFSQTYDVMPFAQGMAVRAIYTLQN